MRDPPPRLPGYGDPLVFALESGQGITREVLARAIWFREVRTAYVDLVAAGDDVTRTAVLYGYIDEWTAEVQALKVARARMFAVREAT